MTSKEVTPVKTWANDQPGIVTDWIEFTLPDDPTHIYRIDVSFMLSHYTCIYGNGCPSILITGANNYAGCCQLGVNIADEEEFDRVDGWARKLTREDADNYDEIMRRWHGPTDDEDSIRKTRVVDGMCIFANRPDGPTGKPGCAFRSLSERLGVSHIEIEPDICWQVPFAVATEEGEDTTVTTVTCSSASAWGPDSPRLLHGPGWYCTETPDAFVGAEPVYIAFREEFTKMMGEDAYKAMAAHLDQVQKAGGRRYPTPGEAANGGRKMIPLMVKQRVDQWTRIGKRRPLSRCEEIRPVTPPSSSATEVTFQYGE